MRMRGCWCLFLCSGRHLRLLNIVIDPGKLNLLFKIAGWPLQIWRLWSAWCFSFVQIFFHLSFVCFAYVLIPSDGNKILCKIIKAHDLRLNMINALGIFRESIEILLTLMLQLLSLNLRAMGDSNNYFLVLHTLAVFAAGIDVSVTYAKLE